MTSNLRAANHPGIDCVWETRRNYGLAEEWSNPHQTEIYKTFIAISVISSC
jgi:hypothetical protein